MEPSTYFKKTIGNIDCDAARGIAHVVDGRATEEPIAVAVYHCFQELPGTVIGDDIFDLMTQRLPRWMTSGQGVRMLTATCHQDSQKIKDENELFLLAKLPQTSMVDPIHFFRRRQLQVFVRVLHHIFVDRNIMHVPRKSIGPGKLLIPTCMKTVERVTALPRPLLPDIQEQLIEVFRGLIYKAIALEKEAYSAEFCFQSEQVLGDFMQLMRIITLSVIKLTRESSSNRSMAALASLAKLLRILNQQAGKRSRMSGRPTVSLAILYVSRFDANDWPTISRSAPDFSASFKDLVESLEDIGLRTFNFVLHRAFYRKRCEDIVDRILGRPSSRSVASEEGLDVRIQVEILPNDLEGEDWMEVAAHPYHEHDEVVVEKTDNVYNKEESQSHNEEHRSVNNQSPRYPERAKIRSPTTGKSGSSRVESRKNF
ncbi:hypothetical protein D9619_008801 [Psilocybe cf. subviscida]|uniref:Uncharacterized protein n=1 Tax=Psilocybe cf. subviscida TaxID=2480587 RepID=A0A8H5F0N5_9AGAR|nr:hypothetical protein D9619_008801 [Psilocybe cf. subviscida]